MNTQPKTTVVIVDEHEAVCSALARRIEGIGPFSVIEATTNPLLAAEIAHELKPDMIIADFKRGPRPRAEMVRWLRRASPNSRLVVYASYYTEGEREAFAQAGATMCLLKGMTPEELGLQLSRLVGAGGAGGPIIEASKHTRCADAPPD